MSQTIGGRRLALLAALVGVYFVAGKLGLALAFVHPSSTAVWPPTGIALAAMLILGRRVWPAILLGAFLVNLTTTGSVPSSLGIAVGNTLEGVVGSYLVVRFAGGRKAFESARGVVRFALLAAMASTLVSATIGVTSLALDGQAPWDQFGEIWLTWWLGDAGGDLVVAPLILSWSARLPVAWSWRGVVEAGALAAAVTLGGFIVFGGPLYSPTARLPLQFLVMPMLIWAAYRFGQRGAALIVTLMYAIALHGTLYGLGPFATIDPNESLLLLEAFTCVMALTTMLLAAVVSERRLAEERLLQLSLTDPLTGLSNYRELTVALERERQRSQRTGLPFALVLLDVDDLKAINDRYGHLVGSRGLCRVAEAMRLSCRVVDTAARYGGDEFALVLPWTDELAALRVAGRVVEQLDRDREEPRVTVSVGVAVHPHDGDSAEAIIAVADRKMYSQKSRRRPQSPAARPR